MLGSLDWVVGKLGMGYSVVGYRSMTRQISKGRIREEHAHKEMINPQLEKAGWYLCNHQNTN